MEKVKVTREQAEAIDFALKGSYKDDPDALLDDFVLINRHVLSGFHNRLKPLKSLSVVDLAKALYIGYEVEGFRVGDWVSFDISNTVTVTGLVESITESGNYITDIQGAAGINQIFAQVVLRYATPEEIEAEKTRRKWNAIGREVDEYKVGDIVTTGSLIRPIESIAEYLYLEKLGEYSADEVYMVCPVEQRLDMVSES
ncbi:hypothetical protein [Terribacillus halophilus]|uniref:hypothetical protein n=1 Tax=Terribacillus halophilus TaxID=361279 RepID=UPI00398278C3